MKIGLSTCSKPFNESLFKNYQEAKIECMEISYSKKDTDNIDFVKAKQYADTYGIELWSMHLPFMPFVEIDISNPLIAKSSVKYCAELIKKASQTAHIKRFVIHPSGEPILLDRDIRMQTAINSLQYLAKVANENEAVICVENLPRTCLGKNSDEINRLICENASLRICFDTNHLLNQSLSDFIRKTAGKIETTHISDYDFEDEKHWMPGEGDINWHSLYAELKKTGYDSVWMYELGLAVPKSNKLRKRDFTYTDFYRNAMEIFDNQPITKII